MAEKIVKKQPKTHPPTKVMVFDALETKSGRNGVSFAGMKKFIFEKYDVTEAIVKFIKKALIKAIDAGLVVKTTGIGMQGSFKLSNKKAMDEQKKLIAKKATAAAGDTAAKKNPKAKKTSSNARGTAEAKKAIAKKKNHDKPDAKDGKIDTMKKKPKQEPIKKSAAAKPVEKKVAVKKIITSASINVAAAGGKKNAK